MHLNWPGRISNLETLVAAAAPQSFTANWVDLGVELFVAGAEVIGIWLNLDVNDSTNMRIRLIAKHTTAGADEYVIPIRTVSAGAVNVQAEYVEFSTDADQKMLLSAALDSIVAYVQFQIQAGAVGAAAGQVDSAFVTTA